MTFGFNPIFFANKYNASEDPMASPSGFTLNYKDLIAPMWSADKKKTLNFLTKYLKDNGVTEVVCYLNQSDYERVIGIIPTDKHGDYRASFYEQKDDGDKERSA